MARGQLHIHNSHDEPAQDDEAGALAAFGVFNSGAASRRDPPFYLWPAHVPAFELWCAVQTQWRSGFAGATGLCYAGVEVTMRQRRVPLRKQGRLFGELQVMERAALDEWARRRPAG